VTDFYHYEFRKARKDHKCDCFIAAGKKDPHHYRTHMIRKGQLYAVISQVYDGNFSTNKLCLAHYALVTAIFEISDYAQEEGVEYARAREFYEQTDPEDQGDILRKMREIFRENRGGKKMLKNHYEDGAYCYSSSVQCAKCKRPVTPRKRSSRVSVHNQNERRLA
jgi:hypothetical protein